MPTLQPQSDTRERILIASSRLFAVHGFEGTSTRQIADEVGIRQPSIFHHFVSKAEVLKELIHRDLVPARQHLDSWIARQGDIAPRLGAYLMGDLAWLIASPFDNRGLYSDDQLAKAEFAGEQALRAEFHDALEAFIAAGVTSGEFRDVDVPFVREVIVAMSLDTIRATATGTVGDPLLRPRSVAAFILRSILQDPGSVETVIADAEGLLASFSDR